MLLVWIGKKFYICERCYTNKFFFDGDKTNEAGKTA